MHICTVTHEQVFVTSCVKQHMQIIVYWKSRGVSATVITSGPQIATHRAQLQIKTNSAAYQRVLLPVIICLVHRSAPVDTDLRIRRNGKYPANGTAIYFKHV